ncbi:hypothetical protein D3C84_884300 [compost metagenome]
MSPCDSTWACSSWLLRSSRVVVASSISFSACSRCAPASRTTSATRRSAVFTARSFRSCAKTLTRSPSDWITALSSSATSTGRSATGSVATTPCVLKYSSQTCLSLAGLPPPTSCARAKPVTVRPLSFSSCPAAMICSAVNSAGRMVFLRYAFVAMTYCTTTWTNKQTNL